MINLYLAHKLNDWLTNPSKGNGYLNSVIKNQVKNK